MVNQIYSLVSITPKNKQIQERFESGPKGFIETKKNFNRPQLLKIELYSEDIQDIDSKITHIALWHRYAVPNNPSLNGDFLVFKGRDLNNAAELDHLMGMRCTIHKSISGIIFFTFKSPKSRNQINFNFAEMLLRLRSIHEDWISLVQIKKVSPKFQVIIDSVSPNIRKIMRMQFDARSLLEKKIEPPIGMDIIKKAYRQSLSLETISLAELQVTLRDLQQYKEKKFLFTESEHFFKGHGALLENLIKQTARKRLFWGTNPLDVPYLTALPYHYKETIVHLFRGFFLPDIVRSMAQNSAGD